VTVFRKVIRSRSLLWELGSQEIQRKTS